MNDSANRIAILIGKHLKQELTVEETQELNTWMEGSQDHRDIFKQLTNVDYLEHTIREIHRMKPVEATRRKLMLLIKANEEPVDLNTKIRNIWPRLSVAAAILVLVAISAVHIVNRSHKANTDVAKSSNEKQDIAPGTQKATLKLADGRLIVLDSALIGQLAQQGSTQILNKSGQLVYSSGAGGSEKDVLWNTLSTSKGQTYPLLLSDGTLVTLNSESSIRFPVAFTGNLREVQVTGEAYFQVAHDTTKPFRVTAKGMELQVLGTTFNIMAYDDEVAIKTTLVEGRVRVWSIANNTQAILAPGEQAILRHFDKLSAGSAQDDKTILSKTKDVDVDAEVAWRFGLFQFSGADLKTVLRQLGRWYDVDILYNGIVPQREFAGKISRENTLSQVLGILETNDVHFKIEGKKIVVSP